MPRLNSAVALFLGLLSPLCALAQDLPTQSRSPLGEAIRATLIENPNLLAPLRAQNGPPERSALINIYADDMQADLSALARAAPRLFDPALPGFGAQQAAHRIALFTRKECAECAVAESELRALSQAYDLRVTLLDMDEYAELARDLDLDLAPSYVFGDMMLRGAMPAIVLERYLRRK